MRKVHIFTNLKVLLISSSIVLSVSGCESQSSISDVSTVSNSISSLDWDDPMIDNSSDISSLNQEDSMSDISSLDQDDSMIDSYSDTSENKEEKQFDYFSSDLSNIEDLIQQERIEAAKAKIKDVFITGVDFIFYDEAIGDVYFDDLTAEGKAITMNSIDTIGNLGEEFFPNWRESLSEKYQVASEFVSDAYLGVLDKIKNYLGEENYKTIGEIKDQVLGDLKDTKDNVKQRVKSWYQEFKSSN